MRHNLTAVAPDAVTFSLPQAVSQDCLRHGENTDYMAALVEGLFAVQAEMRHNQMRHNRKDATAEAKVRRRPSQAAR